MPEDKKLKDVNVEGNRRGTGPRWTQDPYSLAMQRIVPTLRKAFMHGGIMSEDEYTILKDIEHVIARDDPASHEGFRDVVQVRVVTREHSKKDTTHNWW